MLKNKFTKILLLIILSLAACKPRNTDSVNNEFRKKYSKDVDYLKNYTNQLQQQSITDFQEGQKSESELLIPKNSKYDNPDKLINVSGPLKENEADFETHKLILEPRKYYTPDAQTFIEGHRNFAPDKLPPDIFEIRYNTNLHPPFVMTGIEFDVIQIPAQDKYGVSSNLSEKQYLLAGSDSLQRSIDKYDFSRNQEDLEFSEILIKEQKELLKEKKNQEIFGKDEEEKIILKKDDWALEKRNSRNDPVQKIIGIQVVEYNLRKNLSIAQEQNQQNKQGQQSQQNQTR